MSAGDALSVKVDRRLGAFRLEVAFEAEPGGITVLFGPSGAGKSLTLAAVAGALRPDAGHITLGEEVLFDAARRIDVPMERRGVGWVTQDGALFPHLSVDANLRYGQRRARVRKAEGREGGVRFDEAVEILGITHLLTRRPADLSGGERQRVAIGRALLSQPRLLLLDEPLAALDAPRRLDILPYLERLRTACRLPILYVTHAMAEVVRLADRLVLIDDGRVRAQGQLADVLADAAPSAAAPDTLAVIDGRIAAHDPARGSSWIEAGPLRLAAPLQAMPVDAPVRVMVRAGDVVLARAEPGPLSARNVVPGRIEMLQDDGADLILARVRLSGGPSVWSALTRDAVDELSLAPGVEVVAILTSLAMVGARERLSEG